LTREASSGHYLPSRPPQKKQTKFDIFERSAKIIALVAIPVVIPLALGIYSARVQEGSQRETINRDYVQLAVSILKEQKENVSPELRDWATDLLTDHSPTKFSPKVITGLKSGAVSFPGLADNLAAQKLIAVSTTARIFAASEGHSITIRDLTTGEIKMTTDTHTAIAALDSSVVRAKAAMRGHFKTGHMEWPGT
jgi:hypothetical protein